MSNNLGCDLKPGRIQTKTITGVKILDGFREGVAQTARDKSKSPMKPMKKVWATFITAEMEGQSTSRFWSGEIRVETPILFGGWLDIPFIDERHR